MASNKLVVARFLVCLTILLSSTSALSQDQVDPAEVEFNNRDQGIDHVENAEELYWARLSNHRESMENRKKALDKYARLVVYKNEVSRTRFGINNKKAAAAFERCLKATEFFKDDQTDTVIYWRAMCLGLWGANAGTAKIIFKAGRVKELMALVEIGMKHHEKFDDYGFGRIQAGMLIRSKALSMFGLYDPAHAIEILDRSLKTTTIYMSHVLKAEALIELGRRAEARSLLQNAEIELVEKLRNHQIPDLVLAENKIFLDVIRAKIQEMR